MGLGLGFLGALLSLTMVVPQARLIWRDRLYVGVSINSWALLSMAAGTWFGFAVRTGNAALGAGNALMLFSCWWVILGSLRADGYPPRRTFLVTATCWVGAAATVALGLFAPGLVVAIGITASLVRVPQVLDSWRTLRAGTLSEVSAASLWIGLAGNCCWTLHGTLIGDPLVAVCAGLGLVVSATIVALERLAALRRAESTQLQPHSENAS